MYLQINSILTSLQTIDATATPDVDNRNYISGQPAPDTTYIAGQPTADTIYIPGQPATDATIAETTYTNGQPPVDTTYISGNHFLHINITCTPWSGHPVNEARCFG